MYSPTIEYVTTAIARIVVRNAAFFIRKTLYLHSEPVCRIPCTDTDTVFQLRNTVIIKQLRDIRQFSEWKQFVDITQSRRDRLYEMSFFLYQSPKAVSTKYLQQPE